MIKVSLEILMLIALSNAQLNINVPMALPPQPSVTKSRPVRPLPQPSVIVRHGERPKHFAFSYDNTDEYGTRLTREESGDASGTVRGSYSYRDANGLQRIVTYIADQNGFRAVVDSNEPGLKSHNPADVTYRFVG